MHNTSPMFSTSTRTIRSTTSSAGRHWFFLSVAGLLLAGLLFGFAPSFFLRGRVAVPYPLLSLPPYLGVHGIVMTTWYVLFVAQTGLVASHRTDLHRRLGVVAVGVAVFLVPLNAAVVIWSIPRFLAVNAPIQALDGIVFGDLGRLALFSIQVGTAVYFRRKPDVHKRLMMIASFSLYGPVLSRWESFYGIHLPFFGLSLVVVAVMVLYDVVTIRRLHPATLWGALGGEIAFYATVAPLIVSGAADKIINALR